ncbi:MAG: peptidoglycan-binding protein [Phycisphaeraceae bacterium]|nr:peptidoglycan-binding protein [Phycisphaerae bacterium]MBX3393718.1 peptidoglycan-binding protein [Phycisphaeraceae bacterium]
MPIDHTVQAGDCINSIAKQHGFFPDTIWNHPQNSELKNQRLDPNVLDVGDVVHIPDLQEKTESGAVEKRHTFRRKGVPSKLRLTLKKNGEPRANEDYTLDIDGHVITGKTDSQGTLEHPIPPDAVQGILTLKKTGEKFTLKLGVLDPYDTVIGAKQRLKGLGFFHGSEGDDSKDDGFTSALKTFQGDRGMEPTGEFDGQTKDEIKSAFGS